MNNLPDDSDAYDQLVHPLVEKVHDICKGHGLPLFVCVQDSDTSFRTTICNAEDSGFEKLKWMTFAKDSWSVDDLLRRIISDARTVGHSSEILYAMGIPKRPG